METKNKRNTKEGRELLCRRIDALREHVVNVDYVSTLTKKYPEKLKGVKKSKFYSLMQKTGIDKELLELMEREFLPKGRQQDSELVKAFLAAKKEVAKNAREENKISELV